MHVGLFMHRRLKFYVLTHNNPKIQISNSYFVFAGKTLDLSIFDNFGAQLQAPVLRETKTNPPYNVHVGFSFIPQGNEKKQLSILII